jgi:hypothetical protein
MIPQNRLIDGEILPKLAAACLPIWLNRGIAAAYNTFLIDYLIVKTLNAMPNPASKPYSRGDVMLLKILHPPCKKLGT